MATAERELDHAYDTLRWAHDELGLTYDQIGTTLRVSERTLRRWRARDQAPRATQRARIEDLGELRHLLAETLPGDAAHEWLVAPEPALRGRTPISALRAGRIAAVIEILASLRTGAFA